MRIKKTAVAVTMFLAITMVVGVNFADAQIYYTPLVHIPGVPSGGVDLSMYLVGLYDFLLSVVGITAVLMLIIGGMRYITAAGNQASISDAKDIITSTLAGLLLAILSWVIVAEINPDVLYIKKPGGEFVNTPSTDLGKCYSNYDATLPLPSITNCTCKDGTIIGAVSADDCNDTCKNSHCNLDKTLCSIGAYDTNNKDFNSSAARGKNNAGKCQCIDGEFVKPVNKGVPCDVVCSDPIEADDSKQHCGWNFLVVRVNTDSIKKDNDLDVWDFTDFDKNKMYDFFLTNDGTWGAFDVTVNSYTSAGVLYECAILVTARKTTTIGPITLTGDYRNIFWVEPGTEIGMKDGLSMEKETAGNYKQCCEQNLGANPACKLDHTTTTPGCDSGNPGSNAPPSTHCAKELFNTRYSHLTDSACNDCSAASSIKNYHPRHIICDPDTGMWR